MSIENQALDVLQKLNAPQPTVTVQGTTGATNYSYKIVVLGVAGRIGAAGTAGTTSSGNATLNGTNKNKVDWSAVTGATGYLVYRTVGGATQGLIATLDSATLTFTDTGVVADGTSAPSTDATGVGDAVDVSHLNNVVAMFGGTFVGTIKLQTTNDGSNWIDWGSAKTSPGVIATIPQCLQIRPVMTAYTSGAVLGGYSGELSNSREPHFG